MWTEASRPSPAGERDCRPRLSLAALETAGSGRADGPALDPRGLGIGVVHLGLGAFHRAHQAVYTEDAAVAAGESDWGILGVTGRSSAVADALQPQDGLYGVLTRGTDNRTGSALRIIGSLRGAVFPGRDTALVLRTLAASQTRVLTLTITEKGYPRATSGGLAVGAVEADLEQLRRPGSSAAVPADDEAEPARTPLGLLVRGLFCRYRAGGAPLSVLSCDNLSGNGAVTRGLVTEMAAVGGARFLGWIQESVSFPSTMVDRIVPAATEGDRREAAALLGLRDEGLVVAEPFGQWIIEDRFAAPRPAWELAGAVVTDDVGPFEAAKLRLLNGTHSLLAYLGALAGHRTIAEAAADPDLAQTAAALQAEVIPTLVPPPGVDLQEYAASVLARFRNPALGHTTVQVAMDGTQKLPIRAVAAAAELLDRGSVPEALARLVAGWMVFVHRGRDVHGHVLPLQDPLADVLSDKAAGSRAGLADRLFDLPSVFPPAVADHPGFRAAVTGHVADLFRAADAGA